MRKIIDQIFDTFRQKGHLSYGEDVTQLEHALQTAYFAEKDGAPPALVAAAVLHDYGHLLHDLSENIADQGLDGLHEEVGAQYLSRYFGSEVTEPIRLHVPSKRYLCAREPDYLATLSPASVQSLELQGGPFNDQEVAAFEESPHFEAAVQLRRYDDMGKEPGLEVPGLEHYRVCLESVLK
jgi:phosphonate degradation associated HDIG domain protein